MFAFVFVPRSSMPYAQVHYPFENKKEFEDSFPADFIAEGIDQTRGWWVNCLELLISVIPRISWFSQDEMSSMLHFISFKSLWTSKSDFKRGSSDVKNLTQISHWDFKIDNIYMTDQARENLADLIWQFPDWFCNAILVKRSVLGPLIKCNDQFYCSGKAIVI